MAGKYLLGNMLSALHNKHCFYDVPVSVVYSRCCESALCVMKKFGYVSDYVVKSEGHKKSIDVFVALIDGRKVMNSFKLISTPGRRVYAKLDKLRRKVSYNPYALSIVSTSNGVMDIVSAIENKVGGEVLCEVF